MDTTDRNPGRDPARLNPVLARTRRLLPALASAVMLAACFGSGSDDDDAPPPAPPPEPPPTASVPDSALASSTAYTQFTLTRAMGSSETDDALTADRVTTPPSSETDEPVPAS